MLCVRRGVLWLWSFLYGVSVQIKCPDLIKNFIKSVSVSRTSIAVSACQDTDSFRIPGLTSSFLADTNVPLY